MKDNAFERFRKSKHIYRFSSARENDGVTGSERPGRSRTAGKLLAVMGLGITVLLARRKWLAKNVLPLGVSFVSESSDYFDAVKSKVLN